MIVQLRQENFLKYIYGRDFMGFNLQIFKCLTLRAIAQCNYQTVHIVGILVNYQKNMWKYSFTIRKKQIEPV